MFIATDATLIEVNPLAETPDGKVVVADAKINFDDNAAFRQAVRRAVWGRKLRRRCPRRS